MQERMDMLRLDCVFCWGDSDCQRLLAFRRKRAAIKKVRCCREDYRVWRHPGSRPDTTGNEKISRITGYCQNSTLDQTFSLVKLSLVITRIVSNLQLDLAVANDHLSFRILPSIPYQPTQANEFRRASRDVDLHEPLGAFDKPNSTRHAASSCSLKLGFVLLEISEHAFPALVLPCGKQTKQKKLSGSALSHVAYRMTLVGVLISDGGLLFCKSTVRNKLVGIGGQNLAIFGGGRRALVCGQAEHNCTGIHRRFRAPAPNHE
eukprot:scaffold12240_cov170-Amphora_coffeaeformis.AAC.3